MPLETFFNLPEEKQQKILDSATYEFAENGFANASIGRIAKNSGVSKGSMYQYFKDKKELFVYIFKVALKTKLEFMKDIIEESKELDFYEIFEKMLIAGVKFGKERPKLYKMYNKLYAVFQSGSSSAADELRLMINDAINTEGARKYAEFMSSLIMKAMEKGDIRRDIGIDFAYFYLDTLTRAFGEYLNQDRLFYLSDKDLKSHIKKLVNILKDGLKSK
jgi:AcrR family transcriptional regulator